MSPGRHWTRSTRGSLRSASKRRTAAAQPSGVSSLTPGGKSRTTRSECMTFERPMAASGGTRGRTPSPWAASRRAASPCRAGCACAARQQQRRAREDEREHRPPRDAVPPAPPRLGPARVRSPAACGRMRSASMRGPSIERMAGSSVTESSSEKTVTSRPAKPTERSSESGIVSSAAKPIETGKAESRIVQPARRAASSAAGPGGVPRREGLAEAADRQQRVVDAEPEADHRGRGSGSGSRS